MPRVWAYERGIYEWYSYKPTAADYKAVANEVNNYLEMFMEAQQSNDRKKPKSLYLLYSCNEWCELSKASLILVTSDKKTLHAAIGGEILAGEMEYLGESGGIGFSIFKTDLLAGNDVTKELQYGFIKEMDEALLSNSKTIPDHYSAANDYLAADFDFDPVAYEIANGRESFGYGDDELDEEYDNEI
jgi:hypothetical protein